MKKLQPPFSHPVPVATLHGETHLKLVPDAEARARIAKFLRLHAIDAFRLDMTITQASNGLVNVEGRLEAKAWPICGVSLEPFEEAVSETLTVRLAPESLIERMTKRAEENNDEDFEPPDPIVEGTIDFGELATEFLALSLNPFPRKPGAEFVGGDPVEPDPSPFDTLKALKLRDEG